VVVVQEAIDLNERVREFLSGIYQETGLCVDSMSTQWLDVGTYFDITFLPHQHVLGFVDVTTYHADKPIQKAVTETPH